MHAKVAKGVELLDLRMPGWYLLVDTERINIAGMNSCILGQVYGDCHIATRELFPSHCGKARKVWTDHGFYSECKLGDPEFTRECLVLRELWITEIQSRRRREAA